jgi:hypothetical protein
MATRFNLTHILNAAQKAAAFKSETVSGRAE